MGIERVLVANRGEIAIRICRACRDLGITAVSVFSQDDADALHRSRADQAMALPGSGPKAYLDQAAIIAAAREAGCDAIHPGYGFLSENGDFARACADAGLTFVGPSPEVLDRFGDKAAAIRTARDCGIPVPAGIPQAASVEQVQAFFAAQGGGPVMIKALAGGGGRGMRVVHAAEDVAPAWQRCASEALAAFGNGDVYVETFVERARHIEIQLVGDGDTVTHLFDRECSIQRRHQKLVEIAPSPWLPEDMRDELTASAVKLGEAVGYSGVGTVEFLVEVDEQGACTGRHYFIELNPRIQVEHTVTEEITGIDLVAMQLRIAGGSRLCDLPWPEDSGPRGYAIQVRVNSETIDAEGQVAPAAGTLAAFDLPSGSCLRVETSVYQGLAVNVAFDSLVAKVIAHSRTSFDDAVARVDRALGEFRIVGVGTNTGFLRSILVHPDFAAGRADTRFVERHAIDLSRDAEKHRSFFPADPAPHPADNDAAFAVPDGSEVVVTPMQGRISSLSVEPGDAFDAGDVLAVIEAMKMEYSVRAEGAGIAGAWLRPLGAAVVAGDPILAYEPGLADAGELRQETTSDVSVEADAASETIAQEHARLLDAARPETVALARKRQALTARERIGLLADPGSFSEIGGLARNLSDGEIAPADGIVAGRASIEGRPVLVMSQDFSVMGGSAGHLGMAKMERIAALALSHGLPLVMLLDGGGHRIQDGQNSRDYAVGAPLFQQFVDLSGWVPIVAAVLGAGFAANTNFAGCADFVVMVRDKAVMGLAGPALVKAGTGETIDAHALGGAGAQVDSHGLAHLGVDSEESALDAVRRYLSYLPANASLPAPVVPATAEVEPDAALLARIVPGNTRQVYDVRDVITRIVDRDTLFEIRPTHAANLVVGFARMDGRPVGIVANQPLVRAGMLDAPACDKAAHFIAVCDAFGLPLVYLIDVPGFSIGSKAEKSGLGRRSARMIFELGIATVPRVSIVLRKGYGLGYVAMCGGRSFDADLALGWPTAEICAMSVEGSVDVAYRKKYEAAPDPAAKRRELIEEIRTRISPLDAARGFGLDDVVQPGETRARIVEALATAPARRRRTVAGHRRIAPG